jgi:threonine/homoserine/homoserine lactone efflux protein
VPDLLLPDLWLPFLGLIILLTLTPGPDMVLVLRNGVRGGSSMAWATGLGCCTGIAVHAVAATVGLSAVLAASAVAYTTVKLAGAAYLVWLGVTALVNSFRGDLRHGLPATGAGSNGNGDGEAAPALDTRTAFRQGLVSNLLNPKIAILFLTLLPQFVADGEPRVLTTAELAATFVLVGLTFMRVFSLAIGSVQRLLSRERLAIWIERITGTALAAIGLAVALEDRS